MPDTSVESSPPVAVSLIDLLRDAAAQSASDLHLSADSPPLIRRDGTLLPLPYRKLDRDGCARLCAQALEGEAASSFRFDLDLALDIDGVGRCRGSLFRQRGSAAAVFRLVPARAPRLAELDLPASVARITELASGLVLVAGATGSGKSTTLAALVSEIRERRPVHIVTIEDPVEFVHPATPGLVNQREIGRDADSFAGALRHVLRQDPDVVLIGEMRDVETMRAALTLAETGHLVLSTLHSSSALEAPDRLIDAFPADEQMQVRRQVANVLRVVLAQTLWPRRTGTGRVAACELMVVTGAIRTLIREDKTHQILSHVQAGRHAHGMQTMAEALADLERRGLIECRRTNPPEERNDLRRPNRAAGGGQQG